MYDNQPSCIDAHSLPSRTYSYYAWHAGSRLKPYDKATSMELQSLYRDYKKGKLDRTTITITIGEHTYILDIDQMTQRNSVTGRERSIVRIPSIYESMGNVPRETDRGLRSLSPDPSPPAASRLENGQARSHSSSVSRLTSASTMRKIGDERRSRSKSPKEGERTKHLGHIVDEGLVKSILPEVYAQGKAHPDFEAVSAFLSREDNFRLVSARCNLNTHKDGEKIAQNALAGKPIDAIGMDRAEYEGLVSKLHQYKRAEKNNPVSNDTNKSVKILMGAISDTVIPYMERAKKAYETKKPIRADGELDMRFMGNRANRFNKDGSPDKRCTKASVSLPAPAHALVSAFAPAPAVQSPSPDMRLRENRTYGFSVNGLPDRRCTRVSISLPAPARAPSPSVRSPSPLRPDMRLRENRTYGQNTDGSIDRRCTGRSSSAHSSGVDMRLKENRTHGFNKDGSRDRRCKRL